jgi:hypothetical protein
VSGGRSGDAHEVNLCVHGCNRFNQSGYIVPQTKKQVIV